VSDEGRNYVKQHSPYRNTTFWVHYVFGDIANKQHDYQLFVSDERLLEEYPALTLRAIQRARTEMVRDGYITQLSTPAPGRRTRFRFEFLDCDDDARQSGERSTPAKTDDNARQSGAERPPIHDSAPLTNKRGTEGNRTPVPASPKRRKQQIPVDFAITNDMLEWCSAEGIRSDPVTETTKFIDHHRSKGSTFADPMAAWRNWMRNADRYGGVSRSVPARPSSSMQAARAATDLLRAQEARQEALAQ
jgi:hypothetical protein